MKISVKHGLTAGICFIGAVSLFLFAIYLGTELIEKSEIPSRNFANALLVEVGKSSGQQILKRDTTAQRQIAFIVGIIGLAAGVGFFRGIEELCKAVKKEPKEPKVCRK